MSQANVPKVGQLAPRFTSVSSNGTPFDFEKILHEGRNVLLVFYRGHW